MYVTAPSKNNNATTKQIFPHVYLALYSSIQRTKRSDKTKKEQVEVDSESEDEELTSEGNVPFNFSALL